MSASAIYYLLPFFLSLGISVAVSLYGWKQRKVPGAWPFAIMALSQALWTFGYIFELARPPLRSKIFWDNLEFIATASWFLSMYLFNVQFSGRKFRYPRLLWGSNFAIVIAYLILVFTDPYHGLVRQNIQLLPGEPFGELTYDFTAVSSIPMFYFVILFFISWFYLIAEFFNPNQLYRGQVGTIILGESIPMLFIVLIIFGVTVSFHRDVTPYTFIFSNLIISFGLFRYRLFSMVPVGRTLVFNTLADAVVVVDRDGLVVDVNQSLEKILGLESKDLVGQPIAEILSPWPELTELLHTIQYGRQEFSLRRQGELHDYEMDVLRLNDFQGRTRGRLVVVRDITLHKQAERILQNARAEMEKEVAARTAELARVNESLVREIKERQSAEAALVESETLYRTLITALPDAVTLTDLAGKVIWASPQTAVLQGFARPEEVIGLDTFTFILPSHRDKAARNLAKTLREGYSEPEELELKRKDGSTFWAEINAALIRDAEGRPKSFIATSRDVTERKTLESQLLQAQKMEAVGRLAGGVAHDFNNQLMVIINLGELIRKSLPPGDPNLARLGLIAQAGEQAAALTRQLLAFSRKQVIEPRRVEINALLRNLEKMLHRLIGEDVRLQLALEPAAGCVRADPVQIEQIIINLAVNSRDAMPRGGDLTIATRRMLIDSERLSTHYALPFGTFVTIAVSDTGDGIAPETMAHLFEPFFTTKAVGKGTGLGLSTVYGLVKQLRGEVRVSSEPGQGATFLIHIPALGPESPPPANLGLPEADPPERGRETILVIEDNQAVRETIVMMLADQGYETVTAGDRAEAEKIITEQRADIDLVITDVVMPGWSAKNLAEFVAELQSEIPILFISGYPEDIIAHHGVLDAEINYLQKPFSSAALIKKVREILETAG